MRGGEGPLGLFHTHSEAACGNNAENLFLLLAIRLIFISVRYFNRKFTCSSDARSIMSAALDSPGLSPLHPDHRGTGSCLMVEHKYRLFFWYNDKMRGQSDVKGLAQV